jgi:tRNA(Ile)-lysidine synthase
MALLAAEGLDARRLSALARRLRRADAAIEAAADKAAPKSDAGATTVSAVDFASQPAEVALRVLGRAVTRHATEGPVELGKLEALLAAVLPAIQSPARTPFRRTLAGALITVANGQLRVETAPPRRAPRALTKRRATPPRRGKTR